MQYSGKRDHDVAIVTGSTEQQATESLTKWKEYERNSHKQTHTIRIRT